MLRTMGVSDEERRVDRSGRSTGRPAACSAGRWTGRRADVAGALGLDADTDAPNAPAEDASPKQAVCSTTAKLRAATVNGLCLEVDRLAARVEVVGRRRNMAALLSNSQSEWLCGGRRIAAWGSDVPL